MAETCRRNIMGCW